MKKTPFTTPVQSKASKPIRSKTFLCLFNSYTTTKINSDFDRLICSTTRNYQMDQKQLQEYRDLLWYTACELYFLNAPVSSKSWKTKCREVIQAHATASNPPGIDSEVILTILKRIMGVLYKAANEWHSQPTSNALNHAKEIVRGYQRTPVYPQYVVDGVPLLNIGDITEYLLFTVNEAIPSSTQLLLEKDYKTLENIVSSKLFEPNESFLSPAKSLHDEFTHMAIIQVLARGIWEYIKEHRG